MAPAKRRLRKSSEPDAGSVEEAEMEWAGLFEMHAALEKDFTKARDEANAFDEKYSYPKLLACSQSFAQTFISLRPLRQFSWVGGRRGEGREDNPDRVTHKLRCITAY